MLCVIATYTHRKAWVSQKRYHVIWITLLFNINQIQQNNKRATGATKRHQGNLFTVEPS